MGQLKSGVCGAPERNGHPQEQPSPTQAKPQAGREAKATQKATYIGGSGSISTQVLPACLKELTQSGRLLSSYLCVPQNKSAVFSQRLTNQSNMDGKDVDVASHIEDAVTVPGQSGTLIVSTIPPHLGSTRWLVLSLA